MRVRHFGYLPILVSLFLFSLGSFRSKAQNNEPVLHSFVISYNNSDSAGIYSFFSDQMKKALPAEKVGLMVRQLKAQMGNIVSVRFAENRQGFRIYQGKLTKPGNVMIISIDQQNKLAGLFVQPDPGEQKQTDTLSSPDNISMDVKGGRLYGTLSMPERKGKVPVVLMIAGSGPTDRNANSSFGLKTDAFLKLASALREQGIASVRYDKRGVGKSTGTFPEAEMRFGDIIEDAKGFIKMLKTDSRFSRVIVMGHSEGSLAGMIAAAQSGGDAFISLAGAGFSADSILKRQFAALPGSGVSSVLSDLKAGKQVQGDKVPAELSAIFRPSVQPYLISWMKFDPAAEIKKLKVPVLILQGTTDLQISSEDAQALKKAKPDARLVLVEGMNHVLKQAPSDRQQNLATYSDPELPLHKDLIPAISAFIQSLK